ncbi:MAG: DUF488 family protein [Chitinophagales bacterium]|nr:DUF488 family protein [Chitinophagales bacterium]
MAIQIKRIYEGAASDDGYRVLVDRVWPRGISKVNAALDEWNKDVAPSTELRKWFDHIPDRYEVFKEKYQAELQLQEDTLARFRDIAKKNQLTLVYSARDTEHNQARVLMEVLQTKN